MPNQHKVKSFKRLGHVLNRVVSDLGLDERLRQHTLMELWPQLVGNSWAKRSRCLFIDSELNLVVTVRDASTGQELSFLKGQILGKLRRAARAMGIDINGLRFDLKHFHGLAAQEPISESQVRVTLPEPTQSDLAMVPLTQAEEQEIEEFKNQLAQGRQAPVIPSERILALFEVSLRLKRWRLIQGYPACQMCGYPSVVLHGQLCAHCHFSKL